MYHVDRPLIEGVDVRDGVVVVDVDASGAVNFACFLNNAGDSASAGVASAAHNMFLHVVINVVGIVADDVPRVVAYAFASPVVTFAAACCRY